VEKFAAAGEKCVHVRVMANVENELIFGGVEYVVESQGELNNAEIRAEVAAVFGKNGDKLRADFRSESSELGKVEFLDVRGRFDSIEKLSHVCERAPDCNVG
jgi:hypothetical protein